MKNYKYLIIFVLSFLIFPGLSVSQEYYYDSYNRPINTSSPTPTPTPVPTSSATVGTLKLNTPTPTPLPTTKSTASPTPVSKTTTDTNLRTNCDNIAKPAISCPTGYSVTCIPTGGYHWGCGKDVNGVIVEASPLPSPDYQHNESDIEFLKEMASRIDFEVSVDDVDELQLKKLEPRTDDADLVKKVEVRGWDPAKKEEILANSKNIATQEELKMFTEAVIIDNPAIKNISIKGSNIQMNNIVQGKLLGFVPVSFTGLLMADVNYDTNSVLVKVKLPWWSFLVKKGQTFHEQNFQLEPSVGTDELKKFKLQEMMQKYSQTLQLLSNITKTMNETSSTIIQKIGR